MIGRAIFKRTEGYRELSVLVVVVLAIVAVPITGSRLWMYDLIVGAIYAIAVVGQNLLIGLAGQVSFAQTAFMALGGYSVAILTTRLHWYPLLSLVLAVVGSGVAGYLLAFPMLRLRGHYLAMGTFAIAVAAVALSIDASSLTGGAIGISGVPTLRLGGISFVSIKSFYALVWLLCAVAVLVFFLLKRSYIGRAWRTLATREDVASSLGIRLRQSKSLAFVLASILGGLAGALYVVFTSYVSPDVFDVGVVGLELFVILFIGGVGSTIGSVVGALFVILLPQWISDLANPSTSGIVFDALLLVLILVLPQGALGRGDLGKKHLRQSSKVALDTTPSASSPGVVVAPRAMTSAALTAESDKKATLQVVDLQKRYGGVLAVDGVSLTVQEGATRGLIGPNGAGKSTMLGLMSGFIPPSSGDIFFDGQCITGKAPAEISRLGVGRTFQAATPLRGLTVFENVLVGMHKLVKGNVLTLLASTKHVREQESELHEMAHELLVEFGLASVADLDTRGLPFGQLRFLEVARAFASHPRILLLDEPAAGLNRVEIDKLSELIRQMSAAGTGILLVDHDVPFVFETCEHVTAMDFGKVIGSGTPQEIGQDEVVRAAYLGTNYESTDQVEDLV